MRRGTIRTNILIMSTTNTTATTRDIPITQSINSNQGIVATEDANELQQVTRRREGGNLKAQDPFLYYSNQERRMTHLSLTEDATDQEQEEDVVTVVVPQDPQEQEQASNKMLEERKTRLSFELHPSLLMGDLLLEMELEEMESNGVGDDFDLFDDFIGLAAAGLYNVAEQ